MERIILEVDNHTAKRWRYTSPQQQKQIAKIISQTLELLEKDATVKKRPVGYGRPSEEDIKDLLAENRKEWSGYKKLLDKSRKKAEDNGLTEEILKKLLAEND